MGTMATGTNGFSRWLLIAALSTYSTGLCADEQDADSTGSGLIVSAVAEKFDFVRSEGDGSERSIYRVNFRILRANPSIPKHISTYYTTAKKTRNFVLELVNISGHFSVRTIMPKYVLYCSSTPFLKRDIDGTFTRFGTNNLEYCIRGLEN